jgi:hypothetical protein
MLRMKKLPWPLIVTSLVAIGFLSWYAWRVNDMKHFMPSLNSGQPQSAPEVLLFFANFELTDLKTQTRRLLGQPGSTLEQVRRLWDELKHSQAADQVTLMPAGLSLHRVAVSAEGDLYLEIADAQIALLPRGPAWESLWLRSIVQTIGANVKSVARVKILLAGREAWTLGGHLMTLRPYDSQGQ